MLSLIHLLMVFIYFTSLALAITAPPGTIERTTKQQLLASLSPGHGTTPTSGATQMFLTSPSGKYSAYLLRRETSLGAGGFGADFCYVQVQDSGVPVWESECASVSTVNTCSLVFSDRGLEIFDGSRSTWDTDVDDDNEHLQTMVLIDSGDMRIVDKEGELVWKASENPIVNQNCGSIGAPGLAPAHPPFASPIHGTRGPFGQIVGNTQQGGQIVGNTQQGATQQPILEDQQPQPQPEAEIAQPTPVEVDDDQQPGVSTEEGETSQSTTGLSNQQGTLVDNTPFDSASSMKKPFEFGLMSLVGISAAFGLLL